MYMYGSLFATFVNVRPLFIANITDYRLLLQPPLVSPRFFKMAKSNANKKQQVTIKKMQTTESFLCCSSQSYKHNWLWQILKGKFGCGKYLPEFYLYDFKCQKLKTFFANATGKKIQYFDCKTNRTSSKVLCTYDGSCNLPRLNTRTNERRLIA